MKGSGRAGISVRGTETPGAIRLKVPGRLADTGAGDPAFRLRDPRGKLPWGPSLAEPEVGVALLSPRGSPDWRQGTTTSSRGDGGGRNEGTRRRGGDINERRNDHPRRSGRRGGAPGGRERHPLRLALPGTRLYRARAQLLRRWISGAGGQPGRTLCREGGDDQGAASGGPSARLAVSGGASPFRGLVHHGSLGSRRGLGRPGGHRGVGRQPDSRWRRGCSGGGGTVQA